MNDFICDYDCIKCTEENCPKKYKSIKRRIKAYE